MVGGLTCITGVFVVLWTTKPDLLVKEILVIGMLWVGLFLVSAWIFVNRKVGLALSTGAVALIIMSRIEILDWLTGLLTIIIVLGISLL